MEKVSKRVNAIQEVKESVTLLTQLLADYNKDTSSHDNEELIKVWKHMRAHAQYFHFELISFLQSSQ